MFGDFSRFSWWRFLIGAAIGGAMAYYGYSRTGNKLVWLMMPAFAIVTGFYLDEQGSGEGTGGDGDSGGDGGDSD
jgi:hypothetical protein